MPGQRDTPLKPLYFVMTFREAFVNITSKMENILDTKLVFVIKGNVEWSK